MSASTGEECNPPWDEVRAQADELLQDASFRRVSTLTILSPGFPIINAPSPHFGQSIDLSSLVVPGSGSNVMKLTHSLWQPAHVQSFIVVTGIRPPPRLQAYRPVKTWEVRSSRRIFMANAWKPRREPELAERLTGPVERQGGRHAQAQP